MSRAYHFVSLLSDCRRINNFSAQCHTADAVFNWIVVETSNNKGVNYAYTTTADGIRTVPAQSTIPVIIIPKMGIFICELVIIVQLAGSTLGGPVLR